MLRLDRARDARQRRPLDDACCGSPTLGVDAKVASLVVDHEGASLGRSVEWRRFLEVPPPRDVGIAPVKDEQRSGQVRCVLEHRPGLRRRQLAKVHPSREVVLPHCGHITAAATPEFASGSTAAG